MPRATSSLRHKPVGSPRAKLPPDKLVRLALVRVGLGAVSCFVRVVRQRILRCVVAVQVCVGGEAFEDALAGFFFRFDALVV